MSRPHFLIRAYRCETRLAANFIRVVGPPLRTSTAWCHWRAESAWLNRNIAWVYWMTGNRFPAEELKTATGLPVLVDGAQSAGALELDATAFDFFAFSCQKWLCGPDATGGLVVLDPDALTVAAPSYLSQQAYEPTGAFTPRDGAARFDSNWTPVPSLAGLSAALELKPEGRFERALQMAARCRDLLGERVVTAPNQGTLVTFRVDGDPAEAVTKLYEAGVVVRAVPGEPWIRVSCGWWTSDEDLERLISRALGSGVSTDRFRRSHEQSPCLLIRAASGAYAALCRNPSSPAIGRIASVTKRMWSSSSTPSSSAPS